MAALPLTNQRTLDLLYRTYFLVSQSLEKHRIPFFMIGGTLLGAMRHGGVIPWDDDGDLAVDFFYFPKVRQVVVPELASLGVGCSFGRMGNLKLFCLEGRSLVSEGNVGRPRYPIVDIFPFERIGDKWTFLSPSCRERWSEQFFEAGEIEELETVAFGPLLMPAPGATACKNYLSRTYGDQWYNKAVVSYSHISSKPITPIEIELTERRPGLPSASFMGEGHHTQLARGLALQCSPSPDGTVILDLLERDMGREVWSRSPLKEISSERWRQELLAARCGIVQLDLQRFPIKVRCEDVHTASLIVQTNEIVLRNYIQLIRDFVEAGKDVTEWFNINRLPLSPIEPELIRSMSMTANDDDKLFIGVTAEICSLFTDALDIYRSVRGAMSEFANILEWRLMRRLNMATSPPALQSMSTVAQEIFERERAIIENGSGLDKLEQRFAGTDIYIHSWSYLETAQRSTGGQSCSPEDLEKMASIGCDEAQMRLAAMLRVQGHEETADYWLFQAASSGNPNAIHIWSRRPSAARGVSYSECMKKAALSGDVTARILLARHVGGGDLSLYQK